MPFVKRDNSGRIIALSQHEIDGFNETIDSNSPELVAFMSMNISGSDQLEATKVDTGALSALQHSDADIARVTEDLVQLLIAKKLITFTELPDPVQEKLLTREKLRASLSEQSTNLLDDEGSI